MSERRSSNQTRVCDELIAAGKVTPFDQLKWTDFPLETRLRALRALLDASARLCEKRANESRAERASSEEAADKNEEPRAPAPAVKKGSAK